MKNGYDKYSYQVDGKPDPAVAISASLGIGRAFVTESEYKGIETTYKALPPQDQELLKKVARDFASNKNKNGGFSWDNFCNNLPKEQKLSEKRQSDFLATLSDKKLDLSETTLKIVDDFASKNKAAFQEGVYDVAGKPVCGSLLTEKNVAILVGKIDGRAPAANKYAELKDMNSKPTAAPPTVTHTAARPSLGVRSSANRPTLGMQMAPRPSM